MNAASSDFAQQLQANRQGLQQNAIKDLLGLSNQLLGQRPYETSLVQKPSSGFSNFMSAALPAAATVAGGFLGGPGGAAVGSAVGGMFGGGGGGSGNYYNADVGTGNGNYYA
jgi:hypothetical protein